MSSGCPELPVLVQTLLAKAGRVLACAWLSCAIGPLPAALANSSELRVCADPNNLPSSNKDEEGFENKIVDVVARDLGKTVTYVWWAQRRGFIRNTLDAKRCDLVPGIPVNLERLRATKPYYRSAYVFVTRQDGPEISSLTIRDFASSVLESSSLATMAQTPRQWRPWPREASSANWWDFRFMATIRIRTRQRALSKRSRHVRLTSPWSGALWPAISPEGSPSSFESRQFRRLSTARNCR